MSYFQYTHSSLRSPLTLSAPPSRSVNIGKNGNFPLSQWNEAHARQAARALTMSLAMQVQPHTAVDEWILQSVAVKEVREGLSSPAPLVLLEHVTGSHPFARSFIT